MKESMAREGQHTVACSPAFHTNYLLDIFRWCWLSCGGAAAGSQQAIRPECCLSTLINIVT